MDRPLRFIVAIAVALASHSAFASASGVVVSQVYGGGGNAGSTWRNDFIELFNAGSAPVSLAGWSVQYAAAAGTAWQATPLTGVTLQPGQYYLVQEAAGAGGASDLPAPDAVGAIALGATAGKVALVSSTVLLSGANPSGPGIVDAVGFGSTATLFETAPAAAPANATRGVVRALAGCTDTDDNASDFAIAAPTPRNGAIPARPCGVATDAPIYTIQGSGTVSPLVGRAVVTQGVVTRVVNNGFYLQDPSGDGDPGTSDGIFVFTRTAPTVLVGDLARVSATVTEFNPGAASNPDTAAHTVTELSAVTGVTVVGGGFSVAPTPIAFPPASRDDLERVEGMLVTLPGPLTVVQNFFLGQYGQVTLAAQGRVETPTNRYRPGPGADALQIDNKRRSIVLEDGVSTQNPNPTPFLGDGDTLRDGDTVASVTGVVDYGLATGSNADPGSYRIVPTVAPVFVRANPRTLVPDEVGGTVRVASANVLNFFTTFTNGQTADGDADQGCTVGGSTSPANCRGADDLAEFVRQRAKIVAELAAIDADAVGLMEMQNNGAIATQNLVDALNARLGAGTYALVPDPPQGTGSDAIKVAMIYKPARLTRQGASASDPSPIHNRPPLAQTFVAPSGHAFTLVVNHLKSKGCDGATGADRDQGDLQGCFNATRVAQARATRSFVASLFPRAPPPHVLLVGDFNAYAREDPIIELTSNGYVDEIGRFNAFGYSYAFDGAAGRLDQALASTGLSPKVRRAIEWHINADEPPVLDYNLEARQPACKTCAPDYYTPTPYRASDHDPVVIGLSLGTAPPPKPGR